MLLKGGGLLNSVTPYGMVEKQLKPRGITDPLVLSAMHFVPREKFCERALSKRAYYDCSLPIGGKQTISTPYMVAFMLQNLKLTGNEKVLDIGTGSGYQAAVLSRICKSVYSIERIFRLAAKAKKLFDELDYYNISVKVGNGYYGWKEYAPYNVIIAAASASKVPKPLIDQLCLGGKLIIPVTANESTQHLYMFEKRKNGLIQKKLSKCTFVKFVNC